MHFAEVFFLRCYLRKVGVIEIRLWWNRDGLSTGRWLAIDLSHPSQLPLRHRDRRIPKLRVGLYKCMCLQRAHTILVRYTFLVRVHTTYDACTARLGNSYPTL